MVDKRLVKNLRIDPKLWKKAKIEAVKHNMTLQDFIAVAIKDKLSNKTVVAVTKQECQD